MRTTSRKEFQRQLAEQPLQRLYLIASLDETERKELLDLALAKLPQGALIERFSGEGLLAAQVLNALDSPNLLGSEPIVLIFDADKKLLDALAAPCKKLQLGTLLIGTKSKIGASFTEGLICDLTEEKPWEKEKRLLDSLHEAAKAHGKTLDGDAGAWILEKVDKIALSQEMEKLLCYIGDRKNIRKVDAEAICCQSKASAIWQVAEELVWEQKFRTGAQDLRDSSFFFTLLASMRQQLQIGAKMHALMQSAVPFAEWGPHFPKVFPKTLEKRAMACRKLGPSYFRKGLDTLFEFECLAKSSSVLTDALIDHLRLRIHSALSSAKSP